MAIPPKRIPLPKKAETISSSDDSIDDEGIHKLTVDDDVVKLKVIDEEKVKPARKKERKQKKKAKKVVLEDDSVEEKRRFYPSDEKQLQLNETAHAASQDSEKSAKEAVMTNLEAQWNEGEPATRKIPIGWVLLLIILITGACGFSLYQLVKGDQAVSQKQVALAKELEEKQRVDEVESELLYGNMSEAVEAFFSATTVEDILKICRHPERVQPLLEHYYAEHPLEPQMVETITGMTPIALGGDSLDRKAFVVVTVKTDKTTQHVLLEQVSDHGVLVDWESIVSYQPMNWEKYIKERPTKPMAFRVRVKPDHFYTYEFSDEDRYQSFLLYVKDSPEHVFGYVERNSEAYNKLKKIFMGTTPQSANPLILQLRFPKSGDAKNAVIIDEVVQDGWTYDSNPDERLQDH